MALFSSGVERGFCASNPVKAAFKPKVVPGEAGILSVGELSQLLEASPDELIPFVSIGAFAGLRRSELQALDWAQVDFESELIEITAANAKSSRRRFVKIQPNLLQWLLPHARPSGKVTPANLRELLDVAREAAGIPWPSNCLRHTFASAHLAAFENSGETASQLGHQSSGIVFAHYRQLIRPKDALLYWELRPEPKSNVRQIS